VKTGNVVSIIGNMGTNYITIEVEFNGELG
jgi:hypothetical protein